MNTTQRKKLETSVTQCTQGSNSPDAITIWNIFSFRILHGNHDSARRRSQRYSRIGRMPVISDLGDFGPVNSDLGDLGPR